MGRFAPAAARCLRCAIDVPRPGQTCGACLRSPPPHGRTVTGLRYAYPWDGLIQRFKRGGAVELAPLLAAPLAEAVAYAMSQQRLPRPDLLLPVPLAPRRLRERGHNQAWELARVLARRLNVRAEPALAERVIETPHQLALPREQRLANVRGAFALAPAAPPRLAGRRVALVDDVLTTGATTSELATLLLRHGVADVQVWVAARTPLD
jgi:ComF family protein